MNDVHATDALANERTFLAYVRTALACIAFGFVIARFSLFTRELASLIKVHADPAGLSATFGTWMALLGVAVGAYGAYRYIVSARALRAGAVLPMPDGAAIAAAVIIAMVGFVVAWTLFTAR